MEQFTQDELGLIACAIRHPGFPPKPEYLPDCERLVSRGWLERRLTEEHATFYLSAQGAKALELNGVIHEAQASTN